MKDENIKFEEIREYLSSCNAEFCLFYKGEKNKSGFTLKWSKAASSDNKTKEEHHKLAKKYQKVAENCFQYKRNLILKESPGRAGSRTQNWCGMKIILPAEPGQKITSEASLNWRYWQLIIGAGAIHDAGFVLVARIFAKESKEIQGYIDTIQGMMKS